MLCLGVAVAGGYRGSPSTQIPGGAARGWDPPVKPPRTFPATSPLCPMHQDLRSPCLQAWGGCCPRPPQVKRPLLVSPAHSWTVPPAQAPPPRLCKAGDTRVGLVTRAGPISTPPAGVCTLRLLPGDAGGRGGPSSPEFHLWPPPCACQTRRGPRASRNPRTRGRGWQWGPSAGPSPTPSRAGAGTGGTETNKGFSCVFWCPCHCHSSPVTPKPQQWVLSWEVTKNPLGIWLFLSRVLEGGPK